MTAARVVRVAVTETRNAFADMPASVGELEQLEGRLEELRAANVEHHVDLMRAARAQGVQIIGFGELFAGPYFALGKNPLWFALAEDARVGPTVTRLSAAAKELGLIVVAPIYERDPSGQRFNTAVVIDERGAVLGKYRKTHLPCGENEQGAFDEPFYYDKSDGRNGAGEAVVSQNPFFPVFQTSLGRIGVAICHDVVYSDIAAASRGCDLFLMPTNWIGDSGPQDHVAAFSCPVLAADRTGTEDGIGFEGRGGLYAGEAVTPATAEAVTVFAWKRVGI